MILLQDQSGHRVNEPSATQNIVETNCDVRMSKPLPCGRKTFSHIYRTKRTPQFQAAIKRQRINLQQTKIALNFFSFQS